MKSSFVLLAVMCVAFVVADSSKYAVFIDRKATCDGVIRNTRALKTGTCFPQPGVGGNMAMVTCTDSNSKVFIQIWAGYVSMNE